MTPEKEATIKKALEKIGEMMRNDSNVLVTMMPSGISVLPNQGDTFFEYPRPRRIPKKGVAVEVSDKYNEIGYSMERIDTNGKLWVVWNKRNINDIRPDYRCENWIELQPVPEVDENV